MSGARLWDSIAGPGTVTQAEGRRFTNGPPGAHNASLSTIDPSVSFSGEREHGIFSAVGGSAWWGLTRHRTVPATPSAQAHPLRPSAPSHGAAVRCCPQEPPSRRGKASGPFSDGNPVPRESAEARHPLRSRPIPAPRMSTSQCPSLDSVAILREHASQRACPGTQESPGPSVRRGMSQHSKTLS